ncbi:SH3 beta-barrel fold-containing protein [Fibrella aestuarina]|nr:SH3 beta-barrel fold-containing protein [Fibrella aestuarina]
MKRIILQMATTLRRRGVADAVAIEKALYAHRLYLDMITKGVTFAYQKENGNIRIAVGYYGDAPEFSPNDLGSLQNAFDYKNCMLRYYDLGRQDWRDCRVDRLVLPQSPLAQA